MPRSNRPRREQTHDWQKIQQYTRYLDRHGFIRFQDWRLYGERGLAHHKVSVWVYEGTLKLEYQAVMLSKYRVELQEDRKHLNSVGHPRLAETVFRSPQLTLFDLGPDEWPRGEHCPDCPDQREKQTTFKERNLER